MNADFLAINAASRLPDAAWELLYWLAVQPHFQRAVMRHTSMSPALDDARADWIDILRAVAPELRDKRLAVYTETFLYGMPNQNFRYDNNGVLAMMDGWGAKGVDPRGGSIPLVMRGMAHQVDVHERLAAVSAGPALAYERAAMAALARAKQEAGRGLVSFSRPLKVGGTEAGAPPEPAPGAVVTAPGGAVTLRTRGVGGSWAPRTTVSLRGRRTRRAAVSSPAA